MRLLIIGLLSILLTGCETTTTTTAPTIPVVSTKIIQAPFDDVWAAVIRTFGRYNIPVEHTDKNSGVIYAKGVEANDSWHTCKWSILNYGALSITTSMDMNIIVQKSESGAIVDINLSFVRTEIRTGNAKYTTYCASSGRLENILWTNIESSLPPPS